MFLFVSPVAWSPLITQSDPSKCTPGYVTACCSQPSKPSQYTWIKIQTLYSTAHSLYSSLRASEWVSFPLQWQFFQDNLPLTLQVLGFFSSFTFCLHYQLLMETFSDHPIEGSLAPPLAWNRDYLFVYIFVVTQHWLECQLMKEDPFISCPQYIHSTWHYAKFWVGICWWMQ